jgi:UDP-galactopyranose mutase
VGPARTGSGAVNLPVPVFGAGLAGLSAAYHLPGSELLEARPEVGGHCHTKEVGGFRFDEGAHVFFGTDECSRVFIQEPLGDRLLPQTAEIWNNYGDRRYGRYPVQANARALPPELATRCVLDFVEAARAEEREPRTYEEWCYGSFGRAFSDNFMLRYARKVWTVEPSELNTEWLGSKVGGRISRPSLEQVLRGAIDPEPQVLNYLTHFAYPDTGGFGRLAEPLASRVPNVKLGCGVRELHAEARRVLLADGSERTYDAAISTIPLPSLVSIAVDAPLDVRRAADKLMWTSIRCVNLGVARPEIGPGHWVYFYEEDVPFFRASFPSKLSPGNAPAGHSSVSCEIAYSRRKPLDGGDLVARVVRCLQRAGILDESDRIVVADEVDIPYAYVVYDFERAASLAVIHVWMRAHGLYPCGRFGEWGYHWSFEAIDSGRRVAREVGLGLGRAVRDSVLQ